MHLIEIILVIAAGVCGVLDLFEVPAKFRWSGLGIVLLATAAGLFIGHVR